jgi:uncharacterized protein (DUF362 family)
MEKSSRREFVKQMLRAFGASAATAGAVWYFIRRGRAQKLAAQLKKPDYQLAIGKRELPHGIAIAEGGSPVNNLDSALARLGGMASFVAPGDRVLIKPNVGWDRAPEMAANTNPELVGALVRRCFAAGAAQVIVSDNTCNEATRCFLRSGIGPAAEAAGAKIIIPGKRDYLDADLGGELIAVRPVLKTLFEVDRLINVPIVKHHAASGLTIGMKNWYGIIGGLRAPLHQKMDQGIVELANFVRPTLTVVDAHRVLLRNGPTGGSLRDVKELRTLAVSTDPVAADAFGAALMKLTPGRLGYIGRAEKLGLGSSAYRRIMV